MKRTILLSIMLLLLTGFKSVAQTIVSTVTDLQSEVATAANNDIIKLADDFTFATVSLTIPNVNVTVDGGDKVWNTGNIKVTGSGTGTLKISNLKMDGSAISGRLLSNNASNGLLILDKMELYKSLGGAIDISTSGSAKTEINNTRIYNNFNGTGPAVWLGGSANLEINYSTIENNGGSLPGYECGAIASKGFDGNLRINNTVFRNNINKAANTGVYGGGGGAISMNIFYGKLIINESLFQGNKTNGEGVQVKSTYDGGAINIFNGQGVNAEIVIDKTTFDSNLAYDDGGAMMIQGFGGTLLKTTITNCTFYGNRAYGLTGADKSGGAIQFFRQGASNIMTNTFTSCTFVGNISGNEQTAIDQKGGAIGLSGSTSSATMTRNNCLFIGNTVYGSNGEINASSDLKDVSNNNVIQKGTYNVINVDKNATPEFTVKNLLGTETPVLVDNQSGIRAGVDKEIIKTIPIVPQSIADNTYIYNAAASGDQRGLQRYRDQGAVEMAWVKYDANGGTFGLTALTSYDGTEYYESNTEGKSLTYYTVGTIAGETNVVDGGTAKLNATHPDGLVFKGWATKKDTVTPDPNYSTGEILIYANENFTLYAIWGEAPVIYKVSYDPNGGGGSIQTINCEADNTHTILDYNATELAFTPPTSNHEFKGWNTIADGSGTSYTVGHTDTFTENITLFAQWKEKELPSQPQPQPDPLPEPVFKVTYYPNGGSGIPRSIYCSIDRSHVILNYTDAPLKYTPPSEKHQFLTWNTAADGSGISYTAGDKIYPTKDIDLYAVWEKAVTPIHSDPPTGITITPSGAFCPTDSFVTIFSELLYKAELLEYVIKFSDAAKAVDFKEMSVYEELTHAYFMIPLPTDVPTGKYSGTILLRAPSGADIKTDYPFEFELLSGVKIVSQPESVSSCMDDPFTLSVEATGESLSYQWYHEDKKIDGAVNSEYSGIVSASTAGNYYVEVTGTCGTVRSETVYVRMNTLQIQMKWDDVLYVNNTANKYVKFQWYKNGQAIDKFGTSIYYTEQEGLSGSFVVRAYYADGTYDESCPLVVSSNTPKSSVKVYPNPVYKNSTLKVEGKLASGEYTGFLIEMYDLSGRLIYYRYSDSEITDVPVHTDSGVYLLHVTAPDGKKTVTKVMVK